MAEENVRKSAFRQRAYNAYRLWGDLSPLVRVRATLYARTYVPKRRFTQLSVPSSPVSSRYVSNVNVARSRSIPSRYVHENVKNELQRNGTEPEGT